MTLPQAPPPLSATAPPFALEAGGVHAWRFRVIPPAGADRPEHATFRLLVRWKTADGRIFPDLPPTDYILPGPLAAGRARDIVLPLSTPKHPGEFSLEVAIDFNAAGMPRNLPVRGIRVGVPVHGVALTDIDYRGLYSAADLERNHWEIVGGYSRKSEFDESSASRMLMLKEFGLRTDAKVLDVGCGTGQMAQALQGYLSDAGAYCGCDIGREGIAFCQSRYTRPNFRFAVGDDTTLPFSAADGPFDLAIFFSVFTHVFADEAALLLGEVRAALAASGWVIADAFFTPLTRRSAGHRGEMFHNREHFFRLIRLAGFSEPEVLNEFDWNSHSRRAMLRLRPGS
jgi:ubiquinone/menaquinone biosynthesis C-methylase UbiE